MAIQEIHQKNASRLSFEELYRTAYTLVLRKHGKQLYDRVQQEVAQHLQNELSRDLIPLVQSQSSASNPVEVLKEVQRKWNDHCLCMRMISDILMYLDRVYSREAHIPLVYDKGLSLFRDVVLKGTESHPGVGSHIYNTIIDEMQRERNGEIIDRMVIKSCVNMLESLPDSRLDSGGDSVYVTELEDKLKQAAETYYQLAADKLFKTQNDAAIYLRKSQTWLQEESERCKMYLSNSTHPIIISAVQRVLITDRIDQVVLTSETGFAYWVNNDKFDELKLLFDLISLVSADHDQIKGPLRAMIFESGAAINHIASVSSETSRLSKTEGASVRDKSSIQSPTAISIKWVEDFLAVMDKYDKILVNCFSGDKSIQATIEASFSEVINQNAKVSEFLSLFIDDHLKKSFKGKSDVEIEEVLDKAIIMFRYIMDKDLFEAYYKAHLAKRLLNGRSISDDAERSMIAKIKMEIGTAFTSKLEGMFRDMKTSKDTMVEFKASTKLRQELNSNGKNSTVDINVNILTSTNWPSGIVSTQTNCILPTQIEKARKDFEEFYLSRHSGRILSWNASMGTADIKARFKKRTHDINLPTFAMTILLLFNDLEDGQSLTLHEIHNATGIPMPELNRHLLSIAVASRTRLLRKEPMSKDIKPTDKFYFNDQFESPMTRIKVLAVSSGNKIETDDEKRKTMEKVDQARKYETEAAIVRIMKTRKSMEHVNLIAEVTRQLSSRFKPDPMHIKQRIDALLDREYLERDSQKRASYNYLVSERVLL